MFLLNSRSHHFIATLFCFTREALHIQRAHLFPKLRCYFAEFLQDTSLKRLGILYLTTCVGFGYGLYGGAISWNLFEASPIQ